MSDRTPYEQLGLSEDASFDEIQEARQRKAQEYQDDPKVLETLEAAYDAILMERLRMRQEGRIKVPERIRFPERLTPAPTTPAVVSVPQSVSWLQDLWSKPTRSETLWSSGLFGSLVLGTVFLATGGSQLPLLVALGAGITLFWINRKERKFVRALVWTLAGLFGGIGLGSLVISLLGTAPLLAVGITPDQGVVLLTLVLLWLSSLFSR